MKEKSLIGNAVLLLLMADSPANELVLPVANQSDSSRSNAKILYQAFGQIGSGSIGDDYVGTSRIVESDFGLGLRVLPGVSWKHLELSLNIEYLFRLLEFSETATVPDAPPPEMKQLQYAYLKIQPEFAIKTLTLNSLETGIVSELGFRSIVGSNSRSGGIDQSIVIGVFFELKGANFRISREGFYQNTHDSESSNTSIGIGYAQIL